MTHIYPGHAIMRAKTHQLHPMSGGGSARRSLPASVQRISCFPLASWMGICVLIASGCQHSNVYEASSLPVQYQASVSDYRPPLDLSLLARRSVKSELIYPGDVLDVSIVTGIEEQVPEAWAVRVDDQGDVLVPLVGRVAVAGLLLTDAERVIRDESVRRQIYRDPQISVLLNSRQRDQVRVVGAVMNPGVYELPTAGNDLLAALVAAGGLSDDAGTIIEIRHPARPRATGGMTMLTSAQQPPEPVPTSVRVDLAEASQGRGGDYHLHDGSVVMVKERVPRSVYVLGLVHKPDGYELPDKEPLRVLDAIAMAGGRTLEIADKVQVIRRVPDNPEPIVIGVSVRAAKRDGRANVVLAPGDVVSVEETPWTFAVDTLRNFFRFGFSSAIPGI
jgi:polysaccharide export outer membrane protein